MTRAAVRYSAHMIERIVLLKMNEAHRSRAALEHVAERSRIVLPSLPGVVECHVGLAADERTADSWHVSLVLRFDSADDIPPYAAHPDHRAYVDEYLRPRLDALTAFNFDIG
jgi:hypothetical protein